MKVNGVDYYLVVVDSNDIYEQSLFVGDNMQECADFLGCSTKTLYNHKRFNNFDILIVENKEDWED